MIFFSTNLGFFLAFFIQGKNSYIIYDFTTNKTFDIFSYCPKLKVFGLELQ